MSEAPHFKARGFMHAGKRSKWISTKLIEETL